jgi:hypothetical protein
MLWIAIAVILLVFGSVLHLHSDNWKEKHGIPDDWYKTKQNDHGE